MIVIVSLAVAFLLAVVGIVFYYKVLPAGRKKEMRSSLQETSLQNEHVDVVTEEHKLQQKIKVKLDKLEGH